MYYTKERLDQIKQEYEINGVVRIPNAFSLAEVNKMRAEAITSLAKVHTSPSELLGRVKYQLKTSADGVQYPALSFWPALTMPALNRFRCFNRISEVVKHILGPNVKQLNNQFYFRLPGDGDQFEWHRDTLFRIPVEDFPGIEENYLQTAVMLDPVGEDSGAVEYVLGSHKWPDKDDPLLPRDADTPGKLRLFTRSKYQGKKMVANAGDLMIWSVAIIHGSDRNNTNTARMVYMNGFAADHASKYFPDYLKEGEIVENLDINKFPENAKNNSAAM